MWGTLPFGSSLLAILVLLIPGERSRTQLGVEEDAAQEAYVPGRMVS